jgi:hypothetical protein
VGDPLLPRFPLPLEPLAAAFTTSAGLAVPGGEESESESSKASSASCSCLKQGELLVVSGFLARAPKFAAGEARAEHRS